MAIRAATPFCAKADPSLPLVKISKSLEQTKAGLRLKPPKNDKTRILPLPDLAVEALKRSTRQPSRSTGPNSAMTTAEI